MLDLDSLNPEQRAAVETVRGPLLILAGAGTGKTRVITHRLVYLIERGVRPGHLLAVTFTNKAAREMQERVARLISRSVPRADGGSVERPTVCTFHSLCVRILRQHAELLGYKPNFVIYSQSEQLSALRKVLGRISDRGAKVDPLAVLGWLSRLRNGSGDRLGGHGPAAELAERLRARYESALRAGNAMDFDDLILLTLRLFETEPQVLAQCRSRYRHVMVDEYQDTNAAQFRLVHALTREHRNLCVVGDDDQSIYGWRGAEIANLLDLERHYPEVKVVKLEQNYRSTGMILRAANALIRHNPRRRDKRLWCASGDGNRIALLTYPNEEEEARGVADGVEFARRIQGVPWGDQAVLFRTNGQSRPLEMALRQAGIRYHVVGGQSFFDRREVRDFVAYLKVMINPHDDVSLARIANTPARGLSDQTMERLLAGSHQRKLSVYEAMRDGALLAELPGRARESVAQFASWLGRTREALTGSVRSLGAWAAGFLEEIGYFEELRRTEKDRETAEARVQNLKDLAGSLDGSSPGPGGGVERLQEFLEEITLDTEREEERVEAGDSVTLITMHSCKGLEFPHVVIVGLEEGLLPHARSAEEGTLDEERRLFYVALTRARHSLTLSHCTARRKYGSLVPAQASRFLAELPLEVLEVGGSRKPVSREAGRQWFAGLRASLEQE